MRPLPGVAVHQLNAAHRSEIARHLVSLPAEDRRLRFGRSLRDESIAEYVDGIDFSRDRVFGIHAPDLELLGAAHLALDPSERSAELGLSVDASARGRGYGYALLQRGVLHAANLGYRALFMVCLAENAIMRHLAHKAGLAVVTRYGEAVARLELNRLAHGGMVKEAMAEQFALVDCLLKQQVLWLGASAPSEVPEPAIPARSI